MNFKYHLTLKKRGKKKYLNSDLENWLNVSAITIFSFSCSTLKI